MLLEMISDMHPEFPREANTEKMMIRPSMGAYVEQLEFCCDRIREARLD